MSVAPVASVLFADRYVVEAIAFCFVVLALVVAMLWRQSARIFRIETRITLLPTAEALTAMQTDLVSRIATQRANDDAILSQANETIATLRTLNDRQFASIAQLTQRMDLYLLQELRESRQRSSGGPAPALAAV